ncbi:MAG: cytochrome c class [Chitinophagaceae bacterium]|nr:cytochrome c class [Chitinophagaceae bacterium]
MAHLKEHWFPYLVGLVVLIVILEKMHSCNDNNYKTVQFESASLVPDINDLSDSEADDLIRYGRELILNTSKYFGPHGTIAHITNGLNCGNCHLESGTKSFTNNFLAVASTYPRFRERSGSMESVEFRVNDCMQRSLNGKTIDSLSKEMRAMVSYIKWTGKNISKEKKADEAGSKDIAFLNRAADPEKGKIIYTAKCITCHMANGEGVVSPDSAGYKYPPLWGNNSYAVSAGMYRLTKIASFIKNNMPNGASFTSPQLTDEEAWDIAAYINTQPHPKKIFAYDWPVLSTKPVDYPFGPYADRFNEKQHKYGPFQPIKNAKKVIKQL